MADASQAVREAEAQRLLAVAGFDRGRPLLLQLRFIRPAASGVLAAEASVLKAGRSVVHLEARVLDDSDRLVATAAGTFSVVSPEAGV